MLIVPTDSEGYDFRFYSDRIMCIGGIVVELPAVTLTHTRLTALFPGLPR